MGKKSRDKRYRFEVEVANLLGAERAGTKGKPDADDSDVLHPALYVQCKRRARLSIGAWWRETAAGADRVNKSPLLVVREDRGEPLAVVRLSDFHRAFHALEDAGGVDGQNDGESVDDIPFDRV